MTLTELAQQGVQRVRKSVWANPNCYLKLFTYVGFRGVNLELRDKFTITNVTVNASEPGESITAEELVDRLEALATEPGHPTPPSKIHWSEYLVETKTVLRTHRERWLAWPWQPWKTTKHILVPRQDAIVLQKQNIVVMHPIHKPKFEGIPELDLSSICSHVTGPGIRPCPVCKR